MSLQDWLNNRWLKEHQTSKVEITALLKKIKVNEIQLKIKEITPDWRLAFAYNNIMTIAAIALKVSGYRLPVDRGHHEKTIDSLNFTLGTDSVTRIVIHEIRKKRNNAEYDAVGTISEQDVTEAMYIAKELKYKLESWLKDNHSEYLE